MDETVVPRERYLRRLRDNAENFRFVKVITGVRKAGKTTLMEEFYEELSRTRPGTTVLFYRLESASMRPYLSNEKMTDLVYPLITEDSPSFLLLDEVNEIEDWYRFINSLMIDRPRCSIYITGSNAFLLSSKLSTYLSGKTKEIHVTPFSYNEFLMKNGTNDAQKDFRTFLTRGAIPQVDQNAPDEEYESEMDGIYSTIVLKDIMERSEKTISYFRLKKIISFVLESTGKPLSVNRIANKTKISNDTVEKYLQLLTEAYLVYPVSTYNIRGKDIMDSPTKYYAVDNGLRAAALGYRISDMGQLLETAVCLELLRRGYDVYTGDIDDKEIDFVAVKSGRTAYYQVCYTLSSEETRNREFGSLRAVKDHRPKTVLTADLLPQSTEDGIECLNVMDWLRDDGL